ncbi:MAG: (2Fe-2S)-binding protein [Meiothermus sp.]
MELNINGTDYTVSSDPDEMLLWVLRDELGLSGTKFGCGVAICGACTVHLDGVPARSCVTPVSAAAGKRITTVEGLAEGGRLHPVQQAFLELQVPQCGWCMSGQMMTAAAFLENNPDPGEAEVEAAMSANYCRCGCYARIRAAVRRAAELAKGSA